MKKLLTILLLLIIKTASAQLSTPNGTVTTTTNPETGNVGIDNNDPWDKFHVNGTLGIGKFGGDPHSGLQVEYTDGGSGTTVFKHQRWGGNFYFKRNDPAGERTQLFFGGVGHHYMDIYNNNNEVKIRFNTGGNSFITGGKFGIENDDPWETLHVNGTLGIGKFSGDPHSGLQVEYIDGGSGTTVFKHQRWGGNFYFKRNDPEGEKTQFFFGGAGNHHMDIYNNNNEVKVRLISGGDSFINGGNLGIGTDDTKGYKLAIAGKAIAEEIVVKLQGNWPDYVFEKNYTLPNLAELENYLQQNKHLPEIPAAQEIEKNGVNLGEMNLLLMKKVEELTLYMIQQQKIIIEQTTTINKQSSRITKLEEIINK